MRCSLLFLLLCPLCLQLLVVAKPENTLDDCLDKVVLYSVILQSEPASVLFKSGCRVFTSFIFTALPLLLVNVEYVKTLFK